MAARTVNDWPIHESGAPDAEHTALLLPGALCTAAFFDAVLSDPRLRDAPVRWIATTIPGFAGTAPLSDLRFESYASATADLAAELGCDVVVGHSYGANLAIEMLATGRFTGPAVLLSPSFSGEDELGVLHFLNRAGRVPGLGNLVWWAMLKGLPRAMKKELPAEYAVALSTAAAANTADFCKPAMREYVDYLDRGSPLTERLCQAGTPAWVAFGDGKGEVGLTDAERQSLEACPNVELITIKGSGHMALVDQPGVVAELILAAVRKA